jgi:hypothetical protein
VLYSDLEQDRALHHRVIQRVAREKGIGYMEAIVERSGGMHQIAVRRPPNEVHVEQVLSAIGLAPHLPTTLKRDA